MGVVVIRRAMDLAKESGLDLVEISPTAKPPVCRIMDYAKFKYDQEKKERRIKKNQKGTQLKQIRLKPFIDDNDYQVKLRQVLAFLNKKAKVRVNMFYRGRELAHKELGQRILDRMVTDTARYGQPEKMPAWEGRILFVVLNPLVAIAPKVEKLISI